MNLCAKFVFEISCCWVYCVWVCFWHIKSRAQSRNGSVFVLVLERAHTMELLGSAWVDLMSVVLFSYWNLLLILYHSWLCSNKRKCSTITVYFEITKRVLNFRLNVFSRSFSIRLSLFLVVGIFFCGFVESSAVSCRCCYCCFVLLLLWVNLSVHYCSVVACIDAEHWRFSNWIAKKHTKQYS